MTTTTLTRQPGRPSKTHRADLSDLRTAVRAAVAARADWSGTAQLVADQLRLHLPAADVLKR